MSEKYEFIDDCAATAADGDSELGREPQQELDRSQCPPRRDLIRGEADFLKNCVGVSAQSGDGAHARRLIVDGDSERRCRIQDEGVLARPRVGRPLPEETGDVAAHTRRTPTELADVDADSHRVWRRRMACWYAA